MELKMRAEHGRDDGIKTYRYLRMGMIGAVVLLGASIIVEHFNAPGHCWQTSISAYYYTPAREVFVGTMVAVGFALIVIKGRGTFEDVALNFAGMMAPLVAFAPTTDVLDDGTGCWSEPPPAFPRGALTTEPGVVGDVEEGLASWVTANIDNNIPALIWAGAIGLLAAAAITWRVNRNPKTNAGRIGAGAKVSLAFAAVVVAAVGLLYKTWDHFYSQAHGLAAVLMFAGLNLVVWRRSLHHLADREGHPQWPTWRGIVGIPGWIWDGVKVEIWGGGIKWILGGIKMWGRSLFTGSTGWFKAYAYLALTMTVGGIAIRPSVCSMSTLCSHWRSGRSFCSRCSGASRPSRTGGTIQP